MVSPNKTSLRAAFQSRQAFMDFVKAPESPDKNGVVIGNTRWSNKDLEQTPPSQRTWTWYNLPLYWGFTVFGPTGWNVAASLINVGLVSLTVKIQGCLLDIILPQFHSVASIL